MTAPIRIISFKVEFTTDLFTLIRSIHELYPRQLFEYTLKGQSDIADGFVEVNTTLTVEEISTAAGNADDLHRIQQTIKECPLKDNKRVENWWSEG